MITTSNHKAISRLTALWAFTEAGLGGILHAFRLPFTGLLVGGMAVILITLIAYYSEHRFRDIIRATIIVLILKAGVSPHTPIAAYFAVSFQGFAGAVIYGLLPTLAPGAMLLGILAMLESALQKLITLTIIYGNSLWEAIDIFYFYTARQLSVDVSGTSLSYGLIVGYVSIYAIGGILVGILSIRIYREIRNDARQYDWSSLDLSKKETVKSGARGKRNRRMVIYVILLLAVAAAFLFFQPGETPLQKALYVILRSLLIITLWLLVVAPLLKKLLTGWLDKQESRYAGELTDAVAFLPFLRKATPVIWRKYKKSGWLRMWHFLVAIIHFSLNFEVKE